MVTNLAYLNGKTFRIDFCYVLARSFPTHQRQATGKSLLIEVFVLFRIFCILSNKGLSSPTAKNHKIGENSYFREK